MTQTDYFLVLASIVIGLALAELLKGLGHLLRSWASARTYWIHSLVAVNALLFLLQFWWANWSWRHVDTWTPAGLLLMVAGVTALYLLTYLMFPDELDGVDLREYYDAHHGKMWSMVVVYMLVGLVAPRVILGLDWAVDAHLGQQLVGATVGAVLATVASPWVQGPLVTLVTVVNLGILFG